MSEKGKVRNEPFWKFRNSAGNGAELLLYGDISDQTWYGDEVTPKQFNDELEALGNVSEITVRVNSGGGDVFAAFAIGNALKNHPAHVTARIEGCCCSAATIITSFCDVVQAATGIIYMIHPVKLGICGYVDAATLQQYLNALDAIKENIIGLYVKKTGRDKDEITGWMDATSWWTPVEAREKGFVDELLDDGTEPILENRDNRLFVNSVNMNLPLDKTPQFVQRRLAETAASSVADKNQTNKKEENKMEEIKTVDDLRRLYPELVNQIEQAAAENGIKAERKRIQDLEDMALAGSEALLAEAKYEKPMSAEDFAKALVKNAKTQGASYLAQVAQDADKGGVNGVTNAPPSDQISGDEFMAALKGVGQKQ